MWTCNVCDAAIEDDSWRCSASKDLPPEEVEEQRKRVRKEMRCLRCDNTMSYAGTKQFHEGARLGILGDLAELFVGREVDDVYHCSHCGKVEFYVDGIGDEQRGEHTKAEQS